MNAKSVFYKVFPVPKYMEMNAWGIDLSEVSLRFVELSLSGDDIRLGDYGEYPVPVGTISLGRIQNTDVLRDLLRKVKKEHKMKFVRMSLPESYVYHVEMEIVKVQKKEIRESIEIQLEEHVPFKASEVFFDYDILETPKQKPDSFTVVAAVVPKDVVLSYAHVFESAGLTLLSVESDAGALSRAIIPRGDPSTFMILDMGRVKTGVYVASRGFVRLAYDIEIGGKTVDTLIGKTVSVSPEEAHALKEKCYNDEPLPESVKKGIESFFSELADEANKHFIYWHTHKDKNGMTREKIEKVILSGTESALCGLPEYLAGELRVPIEMANTWVNVLSFTQHIPEIGFRESLRFATAIGLALGSKRQ
ncbi:MAG: pilus assembly protein PilM [Parcubacteria group bacterium]|nr:pilus assembly protein PilM [Parcubacteria group bacterium]